jgi:hypothetical protein
MRLRIIHHNISVGLTNTNKHFWRRCWGEQLRENSLRITNFVSFFFLFSFRLLTVLMDTTLIKDFLAPSELSLRPMPSSKPILSDAYELRPWLIEMVQTNTRWRPLSSYPTVWANLWLPAHWGYARRDYLLEAFSIHSERKSSPMVWLNQREDERRLGNSPCRFLHRFLSLIQSSRP